MLKQITKHYSEWGDVKFRLNSTTRRYTIRIKPFKNIVVSAPLKTGLQGAESFLHQKKEWVNKNLQKLKKFELEIIENKKKKSIINEKQAKTELRKRVLQLAEEFGFKINRIFIRKQKTRWGSCSSKGNINLNINLIHLSNELADHVIFHELVHTKIPDHSRKFWEELEKYSSEARRKKRELKEFRYLLY